MIVHNLGKEEVNVDLLSGYGIDEIWYEYEYGYYEGMGEIFYRKGNLYGHHDMSHCSCYDALDRFSLNLYPYEEFKEKFSINKEYWKNIEKFFNAIEK